MNETTQMNNKPWKCGICGFAFKTIKERANCELICARKMEEEAKRAAEAKKKEEQAARKAEVDKAFDVAIQLRDAYLKDYDTYVYTTNTFNGNTDWKNPKSIFDFLY